MSSGGSCDAPVEEDSGIRENSGSNSSLDSAASTSSMSGQWRPEDMANWRPEEANGGIARLQTMESLDWNQVLAQDPNLLPGLLHFIHVEFS